MWFGITTDASSATLGNLPGLEFDTNRHTSIRKLLYINET